MNYKVKDINNPLYNKLLLKELACDYLDRQDVFARKFGFGFFINTYTLMRTKWRSNIEDAIFDPLLHETGFFNMAYVQNIWNRFLAGEENFRERLIFAKFAMFCIWHKYNYVALKK